MHCGLRFSPSSALTSVEAGLSRHLELASLARLTVTAICLARIFRAKP